MEGRPQNLEFGCSNRKWFFSAAQKSWKCYAANRASELFPSTATHLLIVDWIVALQLLWLLSNIISNWNVKSRALPNIFLHVSLLHSPLSPLYRQVCRLDGNLYVSKLYLWTLTCTFEWPLSRVDDQVSFQSSRLANWHRALPAWVSLDLWWLLNLCLPVGKMVKLTAWTACKEI